MTGFPDWQRDPVAYRNLQRAAPANPGAGQSYSATVPADELWRLVLFRFTLATSATVANRDPFLQQVVGGADNFTINSAAQHPASTTIFYSMGHQANVRLSSFTTNTHLLLPLPEWYLWPGDVLTLSARNMQAADAFTNIRFTYELLGQADDIASAPAGEAVVAARG